MNNFRNIFEAQVRVLLMRQDGANFFTEAYYKTHCIAMGYTTPPKKY